MSELTEFKAEAKDVAEQVRVMVNDSSARMVLFYNNVAKGTSYESILDFASAADESTDQGVKLEIELDIPAMVDTAIYQFAGESNSVDTIGHRALSSIRAQLLQAAAKIETLHVHSSEEE